MFIKKIMCVLVLFVVFLSGKVEAENGGESYTLPFHPQGEMFGSPEMALTRSIVLAETEPNSDIENKSLISKISGLEVKNGFAGGDFQITFVVDEVLDKLVFFNYSYDIEDFSFLYEGCQNGSGEFGLVRPTDVCAYGGYSEGGGYSQRFLYSVFIADPGNARIRYGEYYTRQIDLHGGRINDSFEFQDDWVDASMLYPTSVAWLTLNSNFTLFVADPVAGEIFVFDRYGQVVRTIGKEDLGINDFSPYRISALKGPNNNYTLAVIQAEPNGTELSQNLLILGVYGSSSNVVYQSSVPGAEDIESAVDLGFFVSNNQAQIFHFPQEGGSVRISNLHADTQGQAIGPISYNNGKLSCGLPYHETSGVLTVDYQWSIADVYSEKNLYFPAYEPLDLHYTIASPGEHYFALERADDGILFSTLSGAPEGVGVHAFFPTIALNSFSDDLSLRFVVSRDTPDGLQEVKSEPFIISKAPPISGIEAGKAEGYIHCDNEEIQVRFIIGFPEVEDISSIWIKLDGRFGEWVNFYDGFEFGQNSFPMTTPNLHFGDGINSYIPKIELHVGSNSNEYRGDGTLLAEDCDPEPWEPPDIGLSIEGNDQVYFAPGKDIALIRSSNSNNLSFYYRGEIASELRIFDLRGRCLSRRSLVSAAGLQSTQINVKQFSSGVYFAKIGNQASGTIKFFVVN